MLNDVTVFNIREYLSAKGDKDLGEDELRQLLSEFFCDKNPDVERFLKEHRTSIYDHLVASEEIINHLVSIDREARKQINLLITQLASEENVDENLKATDHILWMQKMNNIKNRAEEIVINELIYS